MKILVTGHKGFLGSGFVKRFKDSYDITKAKTLLGYSPEKPNCIGNQLHSTFEDRTKK